MKKTIVCNIPMKENVEPVLYTSDDRSFPTSSRRVRYPICAFLEKTLKDDDELKIILLVKKDKYSHYETNADYFKQEMAEINSTYNVPVEYVVIDTDFEESRLIHEQTMGKLVDEFETGTHILVDITYGPKDLPVVIFAALNFAEKFLECTVENIVYGQASFADGKPVNTKICDMIPLYYIGSITNMIHCDEPDKARAVLKTLLSL